MDTATETRRSRPSGAVADVFRASGSSYEILIEALESLNEGLCLFDADDRMILCNAVYTEYAEPIADIIRPGVTFEEVVRKGIERGYLQYDGYTVEEQVQARLAAHRKPNGSWEMPQPNGDWVLIKEYHTRHGGTAVMISDITELKRRREALEQALHRIEHIGAQSPGVLYQRVRRLDGRLEYTYLGAKIEEIFGIKRDDALRDPAVLLAAVHPNDRASYLDTIEASARDLSDWDHEFRISRTDGAIRWLRALSKPHRSETGEVVWDSFLLDITSEKSAEQALNAQRTELESKSVLLQTVFDTISDGICMFDENLELAACNANFLKLMGLPDRFGKAGTPFERLARFNAERGEYGDVDVEAAVRARVDRVRTLKSEQYDRLRPDGSAIEVRAQAMPTGGFVATYTEITQRKESAAALRNEQEKLKLLIEHMPAAVAMFDRDMRYVAVSARWVRAFRFGDKEVIGLTFSDTFPKVPTRWLEAHQQAMAGETIVNDRDQLIWPDRTTDWFRWEVRPWHAADGEIAGIAIFVEIITAQVDAEEKIRYHASYDPLTGLPNRRLFKDRLEEAAGTARRKKAKVGLLLLDLDGFKLVNDTHGHAAGDQLLVKVAERLENCTRVADTVARLGGDEFTVILPDIKDLHEPALVAQKILTELAKPISVSGEDVSVTASIGIALYPDDTQEASALTQRADAAMYHSKELGKNTVAYFRREFNDRAAHRLAVENELRRAVEANHLLLHYQPKIDLATGACCGVEALVRWQHPERGLIAPAEFIPIAEETGLIVPLGQWVLQKACAVARKLPERGLQPLTMAVNFSSRQFSRGQVLDTIKSVLCNSGIQAERLDIEITEGVVMERPDEAADILQDLRDVGVTVTVDDFGVGYSSLSYLKRLPIDNLKIDASFVRDLTTNPDDASIVSAIIDLAHNLRLGVVAEGVETAEHLEILKARGCTCAQGYYFSQPIPEDELIAYLADHG